MKCLEFVKCLVVNSLCQQIHFKTCGQIFMYVEQLTRSWFSKLVVFSVVTVSETDTET